MARADDATHTIKPNMTEQIESSRSRPVRLAGARVSGYALVGALGTALHWLVYAVLLMAQFTPLLATTVGAVVGACANYHLNARLVFRPQRRRRGRAAKFFAIAIVGMLLNGAVVASLQAIDPWFAQALATLLVLALGYWLNSRWTFA